MARRGASWEQEYRDLEAAVLLRNYSPRTLEAYRFWIARFQAFVRSRPTADLGTQEVRGFLSDLAVREHVAASTQNQAFNALLFFYRHILRREFGQVDGVVRAKRHRYIPVVLSHSETEAILGELQPPYRLVGLLLYGCGLRLTECVNLRIQCFNLDSMLLTDYDLQTIQKLLGHSDIKTTMIYLQAVSGVTLKEARSPLDLHQSQAPAQGRASV